MLSSIIVIPIYKSLPNTYEMVSYARFLKIMNTHQVCFVTHKELDITWYTKQLTERCIPFEVAFFDEKYFKSVSNYSKLLLSKKFYQAFVAYNYLLIFQLDVYIFKDSLEDWIQKGYSYIGAPWILKKENEFIFDGVGNGGFSLRHIPSHLKVLESSGQGDLLYLYVRYCFQNGKMPSRFMKSVLFRMRRNYYKIFKEHKGNEDIFWSKVATEKHKWYTVPAFKEALQFGIETEPQYAFETNNNELPFGCHAWEKYDLNFWKKFINTDKLH